MDLAKFISILTTGKIFLCPLTKFLDPHEGYYHEQAHSVLEDPKVLSSLINQGYNEQELKFTKHCIETSAQDRKKISALSFNQSSFDTELFWKLYSDVGSGIAIRITVGDLLQALKEEKVEQFAVANMMYSTWVLDPKFQYDSGYMPGLIKRQQFSYEKEVRILHIDHKNSDTSGTYLNVDRSIFLGNIVFGPKAAPWFQESVQELVNKYCLNVNFEKSTLFDPPNITNS